MKVLMFSTDPEALVQGSGVERRMAEYADALGELHVVVLARRGRTVSQEKNLFLYPAAASLGVIRLFYAWRIGRMLCRRRRFDVISVQSPDEIGIVGFLLSRRFRIPLQIQIHTDIFSPHYRRASWKEGMRYRMALFLIPRADCLRVVSERIRRSLTSKFQVPSSKLVVLPIFTDVSGYIAAHADSDTEQRFAGYDFKMLAVGRFVDKEKNFSMLIDVMAEFVKICPKALLVLVGDGPDKSSYQSLVTGYRLERNVVIEQWRDDLPAFYKSFDLFLFSSNYEGWGRAVIEVMAAGLPVVMSDVGLAGEVVKHGENGLVSPVGDKNMFLAAVVDLYRNPEKRRTLVLAGKKIVRELSPKTKEEYLEFYKESFLCCA